MSPTTFFLNSLKMEQHHFSEELRLEVESRSAHHQHYDEMVNEFRHGALMHEIQEAGQARVRTHEEHDQVCEEIMVTFEMLIALVKSMGGSLSFDDTAIKDKTLEVTNTNTTTATSPPADLTEQQQQQHAKLMNEIVQYQRDPIKEHHARLMMQLHHYKSFYHHQKPKQKLLNEIREYTKKRDEQKRLKQGMLQDLRHFTKSSRYYSHTRGTLHDASRTNH